MQTDIDRGQAIDATSSKRTFESYASDWLAGRTDLRPETLNLYGYLLRLYLVPHVGHVPIGKLDPPCRHCTLIALTHAAVPTTDRRSKCFNEWPVGRGKHQVGHCHTGAFCSVGSGKLT